MEKYKIGKVLGDGTFGSVSKAVDQTNGQIVAIKKMKQKYQWDESISLAEVKCLVKLHHPNIVRLFELINQKDELYLVFEYMEQNVYQLIKDRQKTMNEIQIRNIIYQTLQGLAYMHKHNYFHRDLKPENLLESNGTIKIADFGLAREIRSKPPYSDYVSTRWYRAPEVILSSRDYSSLIDIFAVGCIMAEIYTGQPIFPGTSDKDQLFIMCKVMGTPLESDWQEGYKLASKVGFKFPQFQPKAFKQLVPQASDEAIDLIASMLKFNPLKRPNASQCLAHKYFIVGLPIMETLDYKQENKFYEDQQQNDEEVFQQLENRSKAKDQEETQNYYLKNARYKPGYVFETTE